MSKQPAVDDQVCALTQELFTKCKGLRRIQVEDLVPSDFNRYGDPLVGSRVMEIIHLVLVKPGFADYKYECVWVVSPNPDGGFMLADRANRDAALDALLPKRLRKTYNGTFRKSHLACALFIIKLGTHKWPGSERYITADQANACSIEGKSAGGDVVQNLVACGRVCRS